MNNLFENGILKKHFKKSFLRIVNKFIHAYTFL